LAPHYDEAAKRLLANSNIRLVKVDSTLNEVPSVEIQGFPTLKFYGKDKSQPPIEYNGGRDADGIITWLKEHTEYDWVEPAPASETKE
jgi:protein disulfide-isomerase A1